MAEPKNLVAGIATPVPPPGPLNPCAPIYIPWFHHYHTLTFHRYIYLPPPPLHFPRPFKVGPPTRKLRRDKRGRAPTAAAEKSSVGVFGTTNPPTTVMIKNIPNQIKRNELLKILECKAQPEKKLVYDFVYLPMDFHHHANYGYAFVNFTTAEAARLFQRSLHNLAWSSLGYRTKKICQTATANIQGKKALVNQFKGSVFPCCSDEYLPVVLSPPPSDGSSSRPVVTVIGKRSEPSTIIA